jgi:phage terminase small subunit
MDQVTTAPPLPRLGFTVSEFCQAHGFGRSLYYKLKAKGLTPTETRIGRIPIITVEAAAAWRKKHLGKTLHPAQRARRPALAQAT